MLFKKKISKITYITNEEYHQRWLDFGININENNGLVDWNKAREFDTIYPETSRDTGAKILDIILDSNKPLKLINSLDFVNDSLFCEWAYVIDFDKNTFEVYEGFNKEPLSPDERFYSEDEIKEYYPVKHIKTFTLNNLPTTNEEFYKELNLQEEE